MAKITINGEVFQWDFTRKPMSEALALEKALGCRYADWESDMQAGSARAICGFIWLVWRRNGRDVPIEDILNGTVEIELAGFNVEADEDESDPTATPGSTPPAVSPTTNTNTSARSLRSSTSGRGR